MERHLVIVEQGVISNIIVVDPADAATIAHFGGLLLPEGSPVGIGWTYDGVNFSAPPVSPKAAIDTQIAILEGKTERGIREGMLYTLVALAAAQQITEPQLYAANYGYKKAKDIDMAIIALRAQRV